MDGFLGKAAAVDIDALNDEELVAEVGKLRHAVMDTTNPYIAHLLAKED